LLFENTSMASPDPAADDDDATLITAARAGEAGAFAQLFDRYYPMIHAFAYRFCLHGADADDIAQETFIKASRSLQTFRGGDLRSWLFRIAANAGRDLHRERSRRTRLHAEAGEQLSAQRGPSDADAVETALAALPLEQRQAVALVFMEGMNHAEAARAAGCAETTISWRIFRAKRRLKGLLSKKP
jgi:RNA polymerase sigma-70 factor, ECF subfamily